MRTRRLGSSGPEISVIGFGAWEAGGGADWGVAPPEAQIVDAIRAVFDAGITWIDTAEVYGDGRSEQLVAEAIAGRRDEVLIASKVAPRPEGTGFRPDEVGRACRRSLERLGTTSSTGRMRAANRSRTPGARWPPWWTRGSCARSGSRTSTET
jgi:aryl-alcohol dehydrogenase-like predicted oxidoreductase